MKKYIIGFMLASLFLFGGTSTAFAQATSTDPAIQSLLDQIQSLLTLVTSLQTQVTALQNSQGELRTELAEVRQEFKTFLSEGISSEEVKDLQKLLALDSDLYPEGIVSGYFGPLTAKAVKNFQKKHNIEQVGVVGPQTRAKLNLLYFAGNSGKTPPGLSKKSDDFFKKKSDDDDGDDDDSDDDLFDGHKTYLCHKGKTLKVATASLNGHFKHGDRLGSCGDDDADDDGDDSDDSNDDSDNDEKDPIISNIEVKNISDSSTTVIWNTDEVATSKVVFNKSGDSTEISVTLTDLVTYHEIGLSSLLPETTYEYVVSSTDAAQNTGTSNLGTFTTLATPDTTSPSISDVSATNTATSTVSVTWTTNEVSDSVVWYGTSSPITAAAPTLFVSNSSSTTSHEIELSNLATSTQYFYIVESEDASSNKATGNELSFATN